MSIDQKVTSVAIQNLSGTTITDLSLLSGNAKIKAIVSPDSATNKKVTFATSNSGSTSVSTTAQVDSGTEITLKYEAKGTAMITATSEDQGKTATCKVNPTLTFSYNGTDGSDGSIQNATLAPGTYKLEVWGAQGGGAIVQGSNKASTAYGGYSTGVYTVTAKQTIYAGIGGKGLDAEMTSNVNGGYNGGGKGTCDQGDGWPASGNYPESSGGGGGATHLALKTGLLSSLSGTSDRGTVLIVGGGGGGCSYNAAGAPGGGWQGGENCIGEVANQLTGYAFGKGEDGTGYGKCVSFGTYGTGGGGGGWFGGYSHTDMECAAVHENTATFFKGGGGSGFVRSDLTSKVMYGYNATPATDSRWLTYSTTNKSATPTSTYAKEGHGYARITWQ